MNEWNKKIRAGSQIQSIIFKKRYWNEVRAKNWLREHNFDGLEVDETQSYLRFRQEDPHLFSEGSYRTINLTKSIKAVVGIPIRKNRGKVKRKTIQFTKVYDGGAGLNWNELPIQYSTSSNIYFRLEVENGTVRLYAINQTFEPCEWLALEGDLALFLDLPRHLWSLSPIEQIQWWNNEIGMIYFQNEPVIESALFGMLEKNRYYFKDGVMYLHRIVEQGGSEIENTQNPVYSEVGKDGDSPLMLLEETDRLQYATIGINRRYLQGLMTRAMK